MLNKEKCKTRSDAKAEQAALHVALQESKIMAPAEQESALKVEEVVTSTEGNMEVVVAPMNVTARNSADDHPPVITHKRKMITLKLKKTDAIEVSSEANSVAVEVGSEVNYVSDKVRGRKRKAASTKKTATSSKKSRTKAAKGSRKKIDGVMYMIPDDDSNDEDFEERVVRYGANDMAPQLRKRNAKGRVEMYVTPKELKSPKSTIKRSSTIMVAEKATANKSARVATSGKVLTKKATRDVTNKTTRAAAAGKTRVKKLTKAVASKTIRATAAGKARAKKLIAHSIRENISTDLAARAGVKAGKRKIKKMRKDAKEFFTNLYKFKFDWTPFPEFEHPMDAECFHIFSILKEHHAKEGISLERDPSVIEGAPQAQGPMHAGEKITVDAIVKTMLSQATNNTNATVAYASLCDAFPYMVDGTENVGTIPNYHDIRACGIEKLAEALQTAGLQNSKSRAIKECLDIIYEENVASLGESPLTHTGNLPNAAQFVPGMLSLDYLNPLSKEEKFDKLVELPLVGVKTAACILAFNFQLPVFAVDTHVFRLAKWLGWIPDDCDRDFACCHLDFCVPEELKYGLHQAFWHHGQRCVRCRAGKVNQNSTEWKESVCPIEQYVNRLPTKYPKPAAKKAKVVTSPEQGERAKKPKGNKTVIRMSTDQALASGFKLVEVTIDDGFGVARSNITGTTKFQWIKKVTREVEIAAEEDEANGGNDDRDDDDGEDADGVSA